MSPKTGKEDIQMNEANAAKTDTNTAREREASEDENQTEGDVTSEDGSDDSDDSSGDVDVDAEKAQRLMALEQELQTNTSYEKYIEYINLLRATPGLRIRLREAHEALAARYPLSEDLWLAWINDELGSLTAIGSGGDIEGEGKAQVAALLGLLRRAATTDYLAPAVWELYLQFSHDLDPAVQNLTPEGVDRYRGLCEEALAAAGLHLGAGQGLWEKYRRFELAVESKLTAAGAAPAAVSRQQDRVRALYQRQMQVPLTDVDQTLEEYKAWEASHGRSVPPHVVKAADKARQAAELRSGFEAGVGPEVPPDVAKLGAFLSYIKMEQNAGDAARVQVVYERAVAAFPLTHSLWLQYGQYMETHTKLPAPINKVYNRAVRNCPWVGAVWERAIRALDRTGSTPEAVGEMYDKALKAGLQSPEDLLAVILALIDYLRRVVTTSTAGGTAASTAAIDTGTRLREAFRSGSEVMLSAFPHFVDRTLRLPGYWAHCEEQVLRDVGAAREVWEGAIKGGLGRYAEVWEAYISMERVARRIKEARALYKRCYSRRFEEDGQLRLCHAWLRFEREEGSAEDYLQALLKVEPILEESAAAAAAAADQSAAAAAKAAVQKAKDLTKEEITALRQAKDPNFKKAKKEKKEKEGKQSKRGRQDGDHDIADIAGGEQPVPLTASKRVRIEEPEAIAVEEATSAPSAAQQAPQDAAEHNDGDAEMAEHEEAHDHDGARAGEEPQAGPGPGTAKAGAGARPHYNDKLTVFIRGLRPTVKDGELDAFLKEHISEGLKDIRLMRDHQTGQARGFAYVECSSRDILNKVVALNGSSFQGQALFIAESKPPGQSTGVRGGGGRFSAGGGPAGRGRFGGGAPGGRGGGFPGGRGRFGGRGGRGGGEGGNADADGDAEMEDAGAGASSDGGRGSHGGRGGGGRAGRHPGLGHPSGRGQMRTHLQVKEGSAAPTVLVPRAVQLAKAGTGMADAAGGPTSAAAGQPLSNDDFRKMLFGGKK